MTNAKFTVIVSLLFASSLLAGGSALARGNDAGATLSGAQEVASVGPATTSMPSALAVAWQRA